MSSMERDLAELERIRDDPTEPRFNRIMANEMLALRGRGRADLDTDPMRKMVANNEIKFYVGDPKTGAWRVPQLVCGCCGPFICNSCLAAGVTPA